MAEFDEEFPQTFEETAEYEGGPDLAQIQAQAYVPPQSEKLVDIDNWRVDVKSVDATSMRPWEADFPTKDSPEFECRI